MSRTHPDESLHERMARAAALGPDHPLRHAITVEIAQADEPTQRDWLDLLRDDERLRLNLHRVEIPASLATALDGIPDQAPVAGRIGRSFRRHAPLALAAMVLLALGLTVALSLPGRMFDRTTQRIARAAMTTHAAQPVLTVRTDDPDQLIARLADHMHIALRMPNMEGFALVGGAVSQIDGKHVLLSRWTRDGRSYSLYQFCSKDFGLSDDFDRRILCPFAGENPDDPCRVIVWTEGHCAYALADETGDYAAQLQSTAEMKKVI